MRSIKKIGVTNFKNFKELEIELGDFNVLIGANASGKSNFVQIFQFLRDIGSYGLDNAISIQGGVDYVANITTGFSDNCSVSATSTLETMFVLPLSTGLVGVTVYETDYEFTLKFRKKAPKFTILREKLHQKVKYVHLESKPKKMTFEETEVYGEGTFTISRENEEATISFRMPKKLEALTNADEIFSVIFKQPEWKKGTLLLEEQPYFFMPQLASHYCDVSIYDFDPKLPKKATPITGKAELEEDATNLSIVLKNILADKEKRRKLFNLVKDLLPFVDDLAVETFAGKSLLFKLKEVYSKDRYLPASLISDGTINITALIVAFYFTKKSTIIIEEPERNLHPYLISKVTEVMKDASRQRQVIVTTHNPEIVKHAGIDNLLLVSRDKSGFSIITRPKDMVTVKKFLKNQIGIEELYVQNLLGA